MNPSKDASARKIYRALQRALAELATGPLAPTLVMPSPVVQHVCKAMEELEERFPRLRRSFSGALHREQVFPDNREWATREPVHKVTGAGGAELSVTAYDGGERGPVLLFVTLDPSLGAGCVGVTYPDVSALHDALGAWLFDRLVTAKRLGLYPKGE